MPKPKKPKLPKVGQEYTFNIKISLEDLIEIDGIEGMNNLADEEFEEYTGTNFILSDINYESIGIDKKTGEIIVQVSAMIEKSSIDYVG